MRKQFKQSVFELAQADERVVVILGDISVYMFRDYQAKFPTRFYNMGICEQTLMSVAAGLRQQGLIPFVHTIGPFASERAMEQIKVDFVYNDYPGNIMSCAGTFDYAWDGTTHHAWVDIAAIRLMPRTQVFQPGTRKEVDFLMKRHYADHLTNYFRLSEYVHSVDLPLEAGRGNVVRGDSKKTTIVTAGPMLDDVLKATEGLDVNVLYFHTIKPFDQELVSRFAHTKIKVVHDSFGLFEAVCEVAGRSVEKLVPRNFADSYGKIHDVRKSVGLGIDDIRAFACA